MRIALIDPSLFTLPHDRALARGLQALGHSVSIYGRRPRPQHGAADGIDLVPAFYPFSGSDVGARLPERLRLGLKGVEHMVGMARLRRRLAGAARPDIVHFMWLPLPVVDRAFLAAFRAIAPLVLTVHDTLPFNGEPTARVQTVSTAAYRRQFDRLIVHTEQGEARLLADGLPAARITRLPVGLSDVPPPAASLVPDPMDGPLTFLLFGLIRHYKGLDLLIEAFARLPPAVQATTRVRVVGRPFLDLEPFWRLARERGIVERISIEPGFVAPDEVPRLFGANVVAVFPYREIEASGVLPNAIAAGRPVIASRIGSFAETLTDGVHGLLVPKEDVEALAAAMARMATDRPFAARCASAMRALSAEVPGWELIARRTAEIYAEIIATRAAEPDGRLYIGASVQSVRRGGGAARGSVAAPRSPIS